MHRWGRRLVMAVAVAAIGVMGFAGTAQASTTSVDGSGDLSNDFGDHFDELGNSLCDGCGDSDSDLVMMWQAILFSEGYLGKGDIDGSFGPTTETATKKWQTRAGLTADGKVGEASWNVADNRLSWVGSGSTTARRYHVWYNAAATGGSVEFIRGNIYSQTDGAYSMEWARVGSAGSTTANFSGTGIYLFSRHLSRS